MKIGEFVKLINSTKDTVRHYEELGLIRPSWFKGVRDFTDKDLNDFQVIKEMQLLGLSLKDIQVIFDIKRNKGCSSPALIQGVINVLYNELEHINKEEEALKIKKIQVTEMIEGLNRIG